MAITLTTSQIAASQNPAEQLRVVVELETKSGNLPFATEPLSWSGVTYAARVTAPLNVVAALGSSPTAIANVKTSEIALANADGFFSTLPVDHYRQQIVTVKEVFLDVPSDALRAQAFTVTKVAMPDPQTFHVSGEDVLANYRRQTYPSDNVLITTSLYPTLVDGGAQNRPIPVVFGRTWVPMYWVDNTSADVFVCCVGCATVNSNNGYVAELFNDSDPTGVGINQPTFNPVTDRTSPIPGLGALFGCFSLYYPLRGGIAVTECIMTPGVASPDGVTRWISLTMPQGSEDCTPDRVLLEMLTNSWAGVCFNPVFINSPSLAAAQTFYLANSIFLDGVITEQRPLEDYLGLWQHDSQTRLVLRNDILLVPAQSRTAVTSFSIANIAEKSLTMDEVPLGQEEDRRTIQYRDRVANWDYQSNAQVTIGSGANVIIQSPFIGRPSMAQRAATYWAAEQFYGRRGYTFQTTVKGAVVEEGDLVNLVHSYIPTTNSLFLTTGVTRESGRYTLGVEEFRLTAFSFFPPKDPAFTRFYQRVAYSGQSFYIGQVVGAPYFIAAVSHQIGLTPVTVQPVWSDPRIETSDGMGLATTLAPVANGGAPYGTTNNSQFIVIVFGLGLGVQLAQTLRGWDVFAWRII